MEKDGRWNVSGFLVLTSQRLLFLSPRIQVALPLESIKEVEIRKRPHIDVGPLRPDMFRLTSEDGVFQWRVKGSVQWISAIRAAVTTRQIHLSELERVSTEAVSEQERMRQIAEPFVGVRLTSRKPPDLVECSYCNRKTIKGKPSCSHCGAPLDLP